MSLMKSERKRAKDKLLADLAAKQLNKTYEEPGPIYSLGAQVQFEPLKWPDLLDEYLPDDDAP